MPRVAQQIVERRAAGRLLQPVDAAEAAIVVDDDDELQAEHHRGGDLRIHHQIGAVADDDDHFAVRQRHLDADPAGDLVAHAGIAVFDVIAERRAGRQSLCNSPGRPPAAQTTTSLVCAGAHAARRAPGRRSAPARWSARCSGRRSPPIRALALRGRVAPGARRLPGAERRVERGERRPRVADQRQRAMLGRVERLHVDADEAPVGVLEQRPGAGGEVGEPRADAERSRRPPRRARWRRRSR